ncbi:MAG: hypothetical protein ACODTU_22250 [Pigmentiphaga sp.]|uniref:hypothetical protein n=1 Tax=Pigmentiphaga sp. TaxID=1977564 RepID=UPI003B57FAC6
MSGIDGIASWNSFAGFSELHIEAGGVAFRGVTGGSGGPPVLLLRISANVTADFGNVTDPAGLGRCAVSIVDFLVSVGRVRAPGRWV